MVEHRDLLDQAQRRIERQEIGEGAEAHLLRRARDRAEIYAGHRDHVERRRMVLGHVIAVEAKLVGESDIFHALVELLVERPILLVDVVENPEFHGRSLSYGALTSGPI